jgi:NAD(P)-dependent dehydrogenase (short-subunit alcohol dehydrogenase family)
MYIELLNYKNKETTMSTRFSNLVTVVTGGSTGIGLAIAKALLAEGAQRVYVTGRTAKTLNEAASMLGERAVAVVSDVAKLSDLQGLRSEIEKHGDQLSAVFANAGVAEHNDFGETKEDAFSKTFDINVKGVFFTVQALLPC